MFYFIATKEETKITESIIQKNGIVNINIIKMLGPIQNTSSLYKADFGSA